MNITLITDIRKITLTSSDYNIIRSITKDKILFQVAGELTESGKNLMVPVEKGIVISDTDRGIRSWIHRGYPVIAWSHEKNPGEDLTKTPWLILSLTALSGDYLEEVWHRFHKIPLEIVRTDRCYLRELSMEDLPDLLSLDAEQEPDSPGLFFKGRLESKEQYLSAYIRTQYPFYGYGLYGAYHKDTDEFLGIAGFYLPEKSSSIENNLCTEKNSKRRWTAVIFRKRNSLIKENDFPDSYLKDDSYPGERDFPDLCLREGTYLEMGYAVKKSARQKGYAKEWIRALTGHAHRSLHTDVIIARIPMDNRASLTAAIHAGGTLLVL